MTIFWPNGTFVFHRDHTFGIGLGNPASFSGPLLEFQGHNFGFGLLVFGAAVLGTSGRSILTRAATLAIGWTLLFATHAGVITVGALSYRSLASSGSVPSVAVELFFDGLHAVLIVLPLAMAVGWVLVSWSRDDSIVDGSANGESRRQRRLRSSRTRARASGRKATA
jgi:hypothetical protein